MKILVINSGSSSLKYQLYNGETTAVLASGLVERIGQDGGKIIHRFLRDGELVTIARQEPVADHRQGLAIVADLLSDPNVGAIENKEEITAVGHRVVHGGEQFSATTMITDEVIAAVRRLVPLAPLHNPANLIGIEVASQLFPGAVQTAVFDTAFHQTMPPHAYRYAIPAPFYEENGIRSYGFHGTSHLYVSKTAASYLDKPLEETRLITAHLGNGASITAVRGGKSIDSSMGFGPLTGLMMGTRSGDIDPAVLLYMARDLGMSTTEIDATLNKKSGLLGVAGSADLRDVIARRADGDPAAALALEMYAYRIKKYIGMYTAVLGEVDALVFTAGIGENSPLIRAMACEGLERLGIALNQEQNEANALEIGKSRVRVLVIPTDEELEIAQQTIKLLKRHHAPTAHHE